jgi:hypothetical protein
MRKLIASFSAALCFVAAMPPLPPQKPVLRSPKAQSDLTVRMTLLPRQPQQVNDRAAISALMESATMATIPPNHQVTLEWTITGFDSHGHKRSSKAGGRILRTV